MMINILFDIHFKSMENDKLINSLHSLLIWLIYTWMLILGVIAPLCIATQRLFTCFIGSLFLLKNGSF